jgi:hypothetical protein
MHRADREVLRLYGAGDLPVRALHIQHVLQAPATHLQSLGLPREFFFVVDRVALRIELLCRLKPYSSL